MIKTDFQNITAEQMEKQIEDNKKKVQLAEEIKHQEESLKTFDNIKIETPESKEPAQETIIPPIEPFNDSSAIVKKADAARDLLDQIKKGIRLHFVSLIGFFILLALRPFNVVYAMIVTLPLIILVSLGIVKDKQKETYLIQKYNIPVQKNRFNFKGLQK